MERGCVWILLGADSELWPPTWFSQHPSLVHRSPGLLSSFPGEAVRFAFSRNPKLCGIEDSAITPHAAISLPQALIQKMESLPLQ